LYSASKNPNTGGRLTPMQNDEDETISTRFANRSAVNNSLNNNYTKNGAVFPSSKSRGKGNNSMNQ